MYALNIHKRKYIDFIFVLFLNIVLRQEKVLVKLKYSFQINRFLHNFFHTDLDFDNYRDYVSLPYYKMFQYIQISPYMHHYNIIKCLYNIQKSAYMYHHNFGFCTGLTTPSLLMNEMILYMHCSMDILFLNSFVSSFLLFLYIIHL